jgi:hypothetical protein
MRESENDGLPEDDLDDLPEDVDEDDEDDGETASDDDAEASAADEEESAVAPDEGDSPLASTTVRQGKNNAEIEAYLDELEESVAADAAAHGGVVPPKITGAGMYPTARLKNVGKTAAQPSDTEAELNGLIAECRFLLHEVAFNSARLTYDPNDRIRFLTAAESLALTAAKVGDTIGRLRAAKLGPSSSVETRRHELVYVHAQTSSPPTPPSRESAKQ